VIRSIVVALILVLSAAVSPIVAHAQAGSPGADHRWSVGTGIGFASSIGGGGPSILGFRFPSQSGFLWQLDGQFRIMDPISVGLFMQVVPVTGGTVFSFAADGRYHFGFLHEQSNEILSRLTPYAGFGFGLAHFGADFVNVSANGALFSFIFGIEYDVTDHIAITSDMRFNAVAGNDSGDSFYYSWQLVGARYRF